MNTAITWAEYLIRQGIGDYKDGVFTLNPEEAFKPIPEEIAAILTANTCNEDYCEL